MAKDFTFEHEGTTYIASYEVTGGKHKLIKVITPFGTKSTQLGGRPLRRWP